MPFAFMCVFFHGNLRGRNFLYFTWNYFSNIDYIFVVVIVMDVIYPPCDDTDPNARAAISNTVDIYNFQGNKVYTNQKLLFYTCI